MNLGGRPEQMMYYGLTSSSEFYMSESSKFVGTAYSPQAKMDISGNAEFFGAGHFKEMVLQGNSRFHYDEALNQSAGQPFIITSWTEL